MTTRSKLNLLLILSILLILSACTNPNTSAPDKVYYTSTCHNDTEFINEYSFDTLNLTAVAKRQFEDKLGSPFFGLVTKLASKQTETNDATIYYMTRDLGIIYSNNVAKRCYKILHSTNEKTEKRINEYLAHILSDPGLLNEPEFKLTH